MSAALAGHFPELPAPPLAQAVSRPKFVEERWPHTPPPGALELVQRVAEEHSLTVVDRTGPCRLGHIAFARHRAMALLRWSTGMSYPAIGRIFRRDHTTVIAGVRHYERHLAAAEVDRV